MWYEEQAYRIWFCFHAFIYWVKHLTQTLSVFVLSDILGEVWSWSFDLHIPIRVEWVVLILAISHTTLENVMYGFVNFWIMLVVYMMLIWFFRVIYLSRFIETNMWRHNTLWVFVLFCFAWGQAKYKFGGIWYNHYFVYFYYLSLRFLLCSWVSLVHFY